MTDRLAEIEERCEKATPGPWKEQVHNWGPSQFDGFDEEEGGVFSADQNIVVTSRAHRGINMRFIAHSREDEPWLIAEVRRLRAEVKRLREKAGEA
jgi:hypothetical protein